MTSRVRRAADGTADDDEVGAGFGGLCRGHDAFLVAVAAADRSDAGDDQESSPIPIEPGMLLELHPNVFIPGEAAGAIGDMVLVTEGGYEILNKFPRELMVL